MELAADVVTFLHRMGRELSRHGPHDEQFDPPYSTIHTGKLNGGTALNIVPDNAELEFEIRNLPNDDPDRILAAARSYAEGELISPMKEVAPEAGIEWQEIAGYPALAAQAGSEWLRRLACDLTGDAGLCALPFGTEGGLFQAIGIPTIVCGPGSIEQAHKADEYVELEQLERCLRFLSGLAERYPGAIWELAEQ